MGYGSKLLTAIPDGWTCKHRPNFGDSFECLALILCHQPLVEKAAFVLEVVWKISYVHLEDDLVDEHIFQMGGSTTS